ncbi:MAG: hypothetical protein ACK4X1_01215 [Terricaulis sp.]
MDPITQQAIGFSNNATIMVLARLIYELDERGVLSKRDFGAKLEQMVKEALEDPNAADIPQPRLDLLLIRQVVKNLDIPPDRWKPTVIDGDKD